MTNLISEDVDFPEGKQKNIYDRITVKVLTSELNVDVKGIHYPVVYEGKIIAKLYCTGTIEFVNQEKWKRSWDFIITLDEHGNKRFARRK